METTCPLCGRDLVEKSSILDKRLWSLIFLGLFIATPVLALATQSPTLFFIGALLSGHALARRFTKTIIGRVVGTICFGVGVVVVYVAIAFAGCIMIMGHR